MDLFIRYELVSRVHEKNLKRLRELSPQLNTLHILHVSVGKRYKDILKYVAYVYYFKISKNKLGNEAKNKLFIVAINKIRIRHGLLWLNVTASLADQFGQWLFSFQGNYLTAAHNVFHVE